MRLPNKRQTFWLLMLASAVGMFLPPRLSEPLKHACAALVAPLSDPFGRLSLATRQTAVRWSAGDHDRMRQEIDLLHGQLAAQARDVRLARQLEELGGLVRTPVSPGSARRLEDILGTAGVLLPARVVLRDSGRRDSVLVNLGQRAGIEPGQRVCARLTDSSAAPDPLQTVLVGQVQSAGPVTARVMLLTDRASDAIWGQVYDPAARSFGAKCIVKGDGPGRLLAENLALRPGQRADEGPPVKPGDVILTAPDDPRLPAQILIGRVQDVKRGEKNPADFQLRVQPAIDYGDLATVFVVDPAGRTFGSEPVRGGWPEGKPASPSPRLPASGGRR